MCEAAKIQNGDTLVGCSLGGMVACEITKIRQIPTLYLIGSAMRKEEVSSFLAAIHPLARLAPLDWLRASAGKVPNELAQMFAGTETSFLRAMCSAVFEWHGLGASKTKVYRIHGRHDLIIPAPPKVDLLLGGGHLISMSHAPDCVEFIKANLRAATVSQTWSSQCQSEPPSNL